MAIFDKGSFAGSVKERRYKELSSPKIEPRMQEYRDGFVDGWSAAADRYIPIEWR